MPCSHGFLIRSQRAFAQSKVPFSPSLDRWTAAPSIPLTRPLRPSPPSSSSPSPEPRNSSSGRNRRPTPPGCNPRLGVGFGLQPSTPPSYRSSRRAPATFRAHRRFTILRAACCWAIPAVCRCRTAPCTPSSPPRRTARVSTTSTRRASNSPSSAWDQTILSIVRFVHRRWAPTSFAKLIATCYATCRLQFVGF